MGEKPGRTSSLEEASLAATTTAPTQELSLSLSKANDTLSAYKMMA
jgi:hypothetical protein